MKAYKFLPGIFALAAIAISCDDDEEDYVIPAMSVDKTALSFDEGGGASAAQTVYVTSNRDWEATCDADWVFFSPTSAKASDNSVEVSVYVDANTGTDRTAKLTFDGATVSATVTVSQTGPSGASYGEGTADSPYTVSDALTIINAGSYTSKNVYVKGFISQITEVDTGSYGNATYYISDDGTTDEQLEVYRGYSLGGAKFTSSDEIQVGDEIIVYGELTMYGTTPEVTQGSSIYYLNGETADVGDVGDHELVGDGTADNPYTATDALWLANDGSYTSSKVYVKGIISGTPEIDTSYGNATYYISDDGSTTNRFEIYRGYSLGGAKFTSTDEIKEGDEVIVYGEITMYYTTPEMTTGSSIYYLNGVTADVGDVGDHELEGDGTVDNPYTALDALWLANDGSYTSDKVYVKGIISGTPEIDTSYGNATYYISDDGTTTNQFYIYRGYSLGGARFTSTDEIKEGDEVIVYGEITMFYSTPEMTTGSSIYSLNGETADVGGGDDGDTGDLTGDGTADNPYTATDALWLANSGNYTDDEVYVKGIISQIDEISTSYGNATYYISDDGTTTEQFEIYRGYSLDGAKFTSSTEIEVGDKVVVCGVITMFYSTPEMTTGSKIVSLEKGEGTGGGDEGGDEPDTDGDGTVNNPYSASEALEIINAGAYTSASVYIKGIISQIDEISTSYGNATYYISDDGTTSNHLEVYRGYSLGGEKFTSEDEIKVGDEVIVCGVLTMYTNSYGSTPEVTTGSSIYSLNGQTYEAPDYDDDDPYVQNVTWTLGNHASNDKAYINGSADTYDILKLGTGSALGDASCTVPAGTKALHFYCIGWNGKGDAPFKVTVGEEDFEGSGTQNSGLANNSPYTFTLSDSDYFEFELSSVLTADTTVTFETTGNASSNGRVGVIGFKYITD